MNQSKVVCLILVSLLIIGGCRNKDTKISSELSETIKSDSRLDTISVRAERLISSGLNAGDGYSEVWIRDLNTFIEPACKVSDKEKLKESLRIFFKFQGDDGNIVDGYTAIKNANSGGTFYYTDSVPGFAAHKNTVETDQEASLIQAIYKYITATGDKGFLNEEIAGISVIDRMEDALLFLLSKRYNEKYGLLWGATTADWGDVQPEHDWGIILDDSSHLCIDIYDNAMFLIAVDNYIEMLGDEKKKEIWKTKHIEIANNTMKYLWDEQNQKFIPHLYLDDSPFPAGFDEDIIYYHGGTATAIQAGLLDRKQVKAAYERMKENMKAANAQTIGLTIYPVYPNGFFKNPGMGEYSYQNGGDWTWFGGRMVQQLIRYELYDEAYEALSPMLDRVITHGGFYEWWTPSGEPKGSGMFRGSAGVLWKSIEMLKAVN